MICIGLTLCEYFFKIKLKNACVSYYDTECMQFLEKIFSHVFKLYLKNTFEDGFIHIEYELLLFDKFFLKVKKYGLILVWKSVVCVIFAVPKNKNNMGKSTHFFGQQ